MYDERMYPDRYSLFPGSLTTTEAGSRYVSYSGTASKTEQPCRFNPKPGLWNRREQGEVLEYDAEIRIPEEDSVSPEKSDGTRDHVVITLFNGEVVSRTFLILSEFSGFGQTKRAFLKEL